MIFQPRMSNRIEGFSLSRGVARRSWNGIVADVSEVSCASYAGGHYTALDPRLFIVLDVQGVGQQVVRLAPSDKGLVQASRDSAISFIPAGMDLWMDLTGLRSIRHLDIHFDAETLRRRLEDDLDPRALEEPRLMLFDERAMALARLIADECESGLPLHDLYGDSLVLSLIIAVLKLEKPQQRRRSPLAPWQMRRVLEFIDTHCQRAIRLDELAALTGMSASQFSHAFKAATGASPHQWQMRTRLDRAKALLLDHDQSLTQVAAETGFADQAHFTRVFRQHMGVTPARWRRTANAS